MQSNNIHDCSVYFSVNNNCNSESRSLVEEVSWISASHTGVESGTDYYYIVVPDTYVVISTKTEVTESPRPGTYGGYFEETTWRTWGEPDDFQ